MSAEKKIKVCVVCTGNICRSPTGEAVLKKKAIERGLQTSFSCSSAGTHAYHVGEMADARSVSAAEERGYDMSGIRAQKISVSNFEDFDIFLAMDFEHLKALKEIKPVNSDVEILLYLEYSQKFSRQGVPDPYYGSANGFTNVLDMIEEGADTFLDQMYSTRLSN
ncbi:low molecular weight phosphotyrosine protein phosphatase [Burkholderiales bacterium]|nr:low molecular weight phosphotyrosine protein phosphatase [Burkholderiales bacterium]